MRLLYFNPSTAGGLADYAHEQANALARAGVEVTMLTTAGQMVRADCQYAVRPLLEDAPGKKRFSFLRRIAWLKYLFGNLKVLRAEIKKQNQQFVLFGSYSEYLAPLWSAPYRSLARSHVKFGAIVHDPVRDYVAGPRWWHRRSIAAGYSFLREAFVHEEIQLDTVRPMPALRTTVIPHGPFRFPEPNQSREQSREKWQIPANAFLLLSFGHIRDGKNLDLAIRALPQLPSAYLLVAGKEQSPGQKPIQSYQDLAKTVGVSDRCRWFHGHVPENEIGNLFVASDLVLLTYSQQFRSASGVLNAAVRYQKPCVASSGGGNLKSVVEKYHLGSFVIPDDLAALKNGIENSMRNPANPLWAAYESENSWQRNAHLVKEKMFDLVDASSNP